MSDRQKKLTIMVSEQVYDGLYGVIGPRHISRFIEGLVRPHVVMDDLNTSYAAMAEDQEREAEALEWAEGLMAEDHSEAE